MGPHGAWIDLAEATTFQLRRFHAELLTGAFPPSELMAADELLEGVRDQDLDGLLVLDGGDPVAGIVTERYLEGRVLLVAYLAVSDRRRGAGVGARLVREILDSSDAELVLAEIEDPRFHTAVGGSDPVARVRFYDRIGARLLPLPYVQPGLRDGSPRVENLLLITLGHAEGWVDGTVVASFLTEYVDACEGPGSVRDDPVFGELCRIARAPADGRLVVRRLDDLDAARPGPIG